MGDSSAKSDAAFVEEYRGFVETIARKLRRQLDLNCEEQDLVAFGFEGLLEARGRFDASRGAQFSTFAYYRVRGAILDGVRRMAFLPRRAYARLKAAEAADHLLEADGEANAQTPGPRDAGMDAAAVDATLAKLSASFILAAVGQEPSAPQEDAEARLIRASDAEALRRAVEALPDRERALVRGFYFEGRQFDDVAAELGISKSWGSRLHAKAIERLKATLEGETAGAARATGPTAGR